MPTGFEGIYSVQFVSPRIFNAVSASVSAIRSSWWSALFSSSLNRNLQNYILHGVSLGPVVKNSLTFSCSTPAESAVKGCALAYALKIRVDSQSPNAYLSNT